MRACVRFTPSDRKIEHTVRSTCVYVRRHREANPHALLSRFTPKDRNIGRTVSSSFELFYFELLHPEIFSAASSMQRPFNISALLREKFTHVPRCRAFISKFFIPRCWILKF